MKKSLIGIYLTISLVTGTLFAFFGDYSYKGFMYNLGRGLVWPINIFSGGTEIDGENPLNFVRTYQKILVEHKNGEGRMLFEKAMGEIAILSYAKHTPTFTRKEYGELITQYGSPSYDSIKEELAVVDDILKQTDGMEFGDVLSAGNDASKELEELLSERPYTTDQTQPAEPIAVIETISAPPPETKTAQTLPTVNPTTEAVTAPAPAVTQTETIQAPPSEVVPTPPPNLNGAYGANDGMESLAENDLNGRVHAAAERMNKQIRDSVTPIETQPPSVTIEKSTEKQQIPDNSQIQKEREELAKYKAKDTLDEANKQINIVWNASTKNIRAAILPEQKEWLKKRENDCGFKASTEEPKNSVLQETIKLRCMAAMTDERTGVLKQVIESMNRASASKPL